MTCQFFWSSQAIIIVLLCLSKISSPTTPNTLFQYTQPWNRPSLTAYLDSQKSHSKVSALRWIDSSDLIGSSIWNTKYDVSVSTADLVSNSLVSQAEKIWKPWAWKCHFGGTLYWCCYWRSEIRPKDESWKRYSNSCKMSQARTWGAETLNRLNEADKPVWSLDEILKFFIHHFNTCLQRPIESCGENIRTPHMYILLGLTCSCRLNPLVVSLQSEASVHPQQETIPVAVGCRHDDAIPRRRFVLETGTFKTLSGPAGTGNSLEFLKILENAFKIFKIPLKSCKFMRIPEFFWGFLKIRLNSL